MADATAAGRAPRRARVRGSTVVVRKVYVQKKHGDDGVARFLGAASADLRSALALADRTDCWVDFDAFVEATDLVDKLFGRGDLQLAWDVGRFGAEHNAGVWRSILMRMLRPQTVMSIAAGVWSHHYDSGRLVARAEGELAVRLILSDFLQPHRAHCLSIAGWCERTLEIGGSKSVMVREDKCRLRGAPACEFFARWSS